ncbi:unnamed protein product [Lupinus luteus]|uniref:SPARK domain-containing protein n=1 Tax=Lupinus luteus TaxID=3873 RepID=A0AAV1Y602_LUPLU
MGFFQLPICYKGSLCCQLFLFFICLLIFQHVTAQQTQPSSLLEFAKEPVSEQPGLFDPIDISPALIPKYQYPIEPLPPMYPIFPTRYEPILSGKCPVNFSNSELSIILDKTAADCSAPLAPLVGNVICCPQFSSLIHIFQGFFTNNTDQLVLPDTVADHCFSDIMSVLAGRAANSTLPTLCSIKSSNFTGGSCPVKDVSTFEKTVNTSKLLEACSTIDQLKECCRPICQPAIMNAALQISGRQMMFNDNENVVGEMNHTDYLHDCKGVVYSYISKKLSFEAADTAFRILSACKVNKVCPLTFKEPSEVISACQNVAAPSPSCCNSLHTYIAWLQKQMLITNKQAIICATLFGSMLRKGGVLTNVYELCDVDLNDFSLPAYGLPEGCLLRSLPANVISDNSSGISFTCDLSENVAAPWPSSSSITSVSLCAPEMSLPALPTSQTFKNIGCNSSGMGFLVLIFFIFPLQCIVVLKRF